MSASGLLLAARELLIDLERTDLEAVLAKGDVDSPHASPVAAKHAQGRSSPSALAAGHKEVLLQQVDQLREHLREEQQTCETLRAENTRLAHDLRSLASQLKQERAASNAMIAGNADEANGGPGSSEIGTGGLTLASAASQILVLRREVRAAPRAPPRALRAPAPTARLPSSRARPRSRPPTSPSRPSAGEVPPEAVELGARRPGLGDDARADAGAAG